MKKRTPDLRKLAKRQRWIIWLVLLSITTQFIPFLNFSNSDIGMILFVVASLTQYAIYILMIVGVVLLLVARGTHVLLIILIGILMIAPCVNILILLLVNMRVTRTLKQAGIRVGFMGVKDEDVERIINPDLCTHCGYNLTGNISGVCSECGEVIIIEADDTPPTTPPVSS